MEHRRPHRGADCVGGLGIRRSWRGRDVEEQRLPHPVEHQSDAHPRREHHRDPRRSAELRGLSVLAQWNPAEAAECHDEDEDDEHGVRDDEEPSEVRDDDTQGGGCDRTEALGTHDAPGQEGKYQNGCRAEDPAIQSGPALTTLFARPRVTGMVTELCLRGLITRHESVPSSRSTLHGARPGTSLPSSIADIVSFHGFGDRPVPQKMELSRQRRTVSRQSGKSDPVRLRSDGHGPRRPASSPTAFPGRRPATGCRRTSSPRRPVATEDNSRSAVLPRS